MPERCSQSTTEGRDARHVDAGTGEDSVYSNDSRQDTIRCGTSSHLQSTTLNGKTISIQTPDIDRSWSDDADAVTECERRL